MKNISIISGFNIFQVQGVNYVTNTFLEGIDIFNRRGYDIFRLYYPNGYIDYVNGYNLPQFAKNIALSSKNNNVLIGCARKCIRFLFHLKIFPLEYVRFYMYTYRPAKKAIDLFFKNDNNKTDIIIFHGYLLPYIAFKYYPNKIKSYKTISVMHTGIDPFDQYDYLFPSLMRNTFTNHILRTQLITGVKSVDYLVTLSTIAKKSFYWIDDGKKIVIYNGIKNINRLESNRYLSIGKINFVCVASIQKRKGQNLLIEAFSKLSNKVLDRIHLHLIGDGPDKVLLEHRVHELNLSQVITFWGSRSDVPALLSQMDIFILASYAEGLPISVIEALRQGLYIIVSPVGGCTDMISPDYGRLIQLDIADIANNIEEVVISGCYKNVAAFSRGKFEKDFSLDRMILSYCELFDNIRS